MTEPPTQFSIESSVVAFVIEIDIRHLVLDRHRPSLWALAQLGKTIEQESWCLVGGMMVLVALAEQGNAPTRSTQTKDADVLVDICTSPKSLAKVVNELTTSGFTLAEEQYGEDFARCTFVSQNQQSQVDVLCPDDAPTEGLILSSGFESIAIPGGRRALEVAESVKVRYSDDAPDAEIRVPLIAGALVVKTAAVFDDKTSDQHRHLEDVIELLLGINDPASHREKLSTADRELLSLLTTRLDNTMWNELTPSLQNQALTALEILIN